MEMKLTSLTSKHLENFCWWKVTLALTSESKYMRWGKNLWKYLEKFAFSRTKQEGNVQFFLIKSKLQTTAEYMSTSTEKMSQSSQITNSLGEKGLIPGTAWPVRQLLSLTAFLALRPKHVHWFFRWNKTKAEKCQQPEKESSVSASGLRPPLLFVVPNQPHLKPDLPRLFRAGLVNGKWIVVLHYN